MSHATEVRERLQREDVHFQSLVRKHQEYDERLQVLRSRKYLTQEEQLEEVRLKKLKLALKDQMEALVRSAAD
jgi:uncharacterized protein YdcH (DUF465 family)